MNPHPDIGHDDHPDGLVAGTDHSRILEKGLSLGHSDGDASEGGRTEVDHRHVSSEAASRSPSAPREGGAGASSAAVTASLPPPSFIYDRHILLPPYLVAEGHVPKMFSTNLAERYAVAYLRPYIRRKTARGGNDQTVGRAIYVDGQREVLALVDPTSGVLKREVPISAIFGVMVEGKLGERGAAETETLAIILAPKKSLASPMAAASPPRTPRGLAGTPHDPRRPSHLPEVEEACPERLQGNDFNLMLRFDPFPAPQSARSKAVSSSMGSQRDHLESLIATLKHFNPKIQVSQGKAPGTLQKLAPSLNLVKPKDHVPLKEVVPDCLKNPPTQSEKEAPEFDIPDDDNHHQDDSGAPGDDDGGVDGTLGGYTGDNDDGYDTYNNDTATIGGNGGGNGGGGNDDSDLEALERNLGDGGLDVDDTHHDPTAAVSPPFNPAATRSPPFDGGLGSGGVLDSPYGFIPYAESEGDASEYAADARRRSSVLPPNMQPPMAAIIPPKATVVVDPLRSETQWAAHERTQLMDTWRALQGKRQVSGSGGVVVPTKMGSIPPSSDPLTEEVQHAHTYFTADEDPARQGFVLGHLPACLSRSTPKQSNSNTDGDGGEEGKDVDTDVEDPMDPDVRAKEIAEEIARTPDSATAEDPSVASSFLQRRLHSLLTTPTIKDTPIGQLFQSTLSSVAVGTSSLSSSSGGDIANHGYYSHNPLRLLESWDGTRRKGDGSGDGGEEEDDIVQALGEFREILSSSGEKRALLDNHSRPAILSSVFYGLPYPGGVVTEEVEAMRGHVSGLIYASPLNNNIDEELYGAQQQLLGILLQTPPSATTSGAAAAASGSVDAPVELVENEEEQTIARLSTATPTTTPVPDLFPPLLDLPALIRTVENGSALDRKGFLQWRDRISKTAANDARLYLDDDVDPPEYTPPAEGEDSLLSRPGGFLEWAHQQHVSRQSGGGGGSAAAERGGGVSGHIHTTTSSMRPTKSTTSNSNNAAQSLATMAANAQQFTAADDVVLQSAQEEDSYAAIWRGAVVQRLHRFISTHLSKEVAWQLGMAGIKLRIEEEISPWLALSWPTHIRVCNRKAAGVKMDPSNPPISHSEMLFHACIDAWSRRAERHMNDSVYDSITTGVSYRRLGCGGSGDEVVDALVWWRSLLDAVSKTLSDTTPHSSIFSPSLYRYNICQYEISRAEIDEGREIMADLKQRIRNVDTLVIEARDAARSTDHLQGAGPTAVNSSVPSLHQVVAGSRDTAPHNRTRASIAADDRRVAHPNYNREINLATLVFNICELQRQRLAML